MGLLIAMAPCYCCSRVFAFNPIRVPSCAGRPICEACMGDVNAKRRELGQPEWPIYADSYSDEEV